MVQKKVDSKKNNKKPVKEATKKVEHKDIVSEGVSVDAKNRKRKIDIRMVVVSAVLFVAVVVVVIILRIYGRGAVINDDYFVTDGTKIVQAFDSDDTLPLENKTGYKASKIYTVYYYFGNNITDIKVFYRYDNEGEAEAVYENTQIDCSDLYSNDSMEVEANGKTTTPICNNWANSKSRDGQYVILQYKKNLVEGITTEQVRKASEDNE